VSIKLGLCFYTTYQPNIKGLWVYENGYILMASGPLFIETLLIICLASSKICIQMKGLTDNTFTVSSFWFHVEIAACLYILNVQAFSYQVSSLTHQWSEQTIIIHQYHLEEAKWKYITKQHWRFFMFYSCNNLTNTLTGNRGNIKWAASRQNQHSALATSMDPDQPAHLRSLIRIHAVR
jgi:hypothetical protein